MSEARKTCSVFGCNAAIVAKFMCDTHYRRVRDHGHAGPATPDRGERTRHPLYVTWKGLMQEHKERCVPEWHDLWRFVADVKDPPPVPAARFRRSDLARPYGPDNWFWYETRQTNGDKASLVIARRENQRALRAANPDYFLDRDLRKHFGVTLEWYREQLDRQGGVCAICKQPETVQIHGRVLRLAVDHCHDEGHVRGLLCTKCNRGLGLFRHEPGLLLAAVEYLKGT